MDRRNFIKTLGIVPVSLVAGKAVAGTTKKINLDTEIVSEDKLFSGSVGRYDGVSVLVDNEYAAKLWAKQIHKEAVKNSLLAKYL